MSKYGEGTGVPMGLCTDPNKPSFDPASIETSGQKKLAWLISNSWEKLTPWEQKFLTSCYGVIPMSRKQNIIISKLHRKLTAAPKANP